MCSNNKWCTLFLRKTSVKRDGVTYAYAQLVESFRHPDTGTPTTRVLANLGQLSALEFNNFKIALAASKSGQPLVIGSTPRPETKKFFKPTQNLDYLDLAVLWAQWRDVGFEGFFQSAFRHAKLDMDASHTLAALVLHRLVDPGSKVSATRWFPKTALPELFGIDPATFNNSRIHRVLELLEGQNSSLVAKMPYLASTASVPTFVSMFLDVTDTWFVGAGSILAQYGKTKEGLLRHKIGIVLLCDQAGFPLRWQVVGGVRNDLKTMGEMLEAIHKLPWTKNTPIVCDRSMGKTAQIFDMHALGIHFVTAATRTEYLSFAPDLPALVADLIIDRPPQSTESLAAAALRAAKASTLEEVHENLFIKDFGLVKRKALIQSSRRGDDDSGDGAIGRGHAALRICKKIDQGVADGIYASWQAAGVVLGIKKGLVAKYRQLCQLPLAVQAQVMRGEADGLTIDALISLAKLPSDQACQRFAELKAKQVPKQRQPNVEKPRRSVEKKSIEFDCRVIVCFNPEKYADMKAKAERTLHRVAAFAADLNQRLASGCGRARTHAHILAEGERFLRRDDLIEVFKVEVSVDKTSDRAVTKVKFDLKEIEWARRQRFNGFFLLVAHPDIQLSAADIARLYREKNAIEFDFRTIKSQIEIRPIRHFTDSKVTAHVTICVLALALERHLQKKLGTNSSVDAALDTLRTCRLNRYANDAASFYVSTETDLPQRKLLKMLALEPLANDDFIRETLMPRN